MWVAILTIIIGWLLTVLAFSQKGALIGVIIMVVAFGFSIFTITFTVQQNPIQVGGVNIITPSGNIMIPQYNETTQPTTNTLNVEAAFEQLNAIVEFGFTVLIVGYLFFERRENKRIRFRK